MRILVTDGNTRSALAAVRSLGRAGHTVFVAAAAQPSLAGVSRYAAGLDEYPDPLKDAAAFMPALAAIVRRRDIEVLLPMTEITTLLVTGEQQALPASCRLPFPAVDVVDRASDKSQVLALAQELGIPTPASVVLRAAADAHAYDGSLGWPVVVKPARSRVRLGSGWFSTSVAYAARRRRSAQAPRHPSRPRRIRYCFRSASKDPVPACLPASTGAVPWRCSRTGACARNRRPAA